MNNPAQDWNIGRMAVDFLTKRGITTYEGYEKIFQPNVNYVINAPYIPNWYVGMDLFLKHVNSRSKFGIYGDYDCDGTTSAAMFTRFLKGLGLEVVNLMASRLTGYGFGTNAAHKFANAGCQFVMTLDCGSNDLAALDMLRVDGIEFCVLDHHNMSMKPSNYTIINAQLNDIPDESHSLCSGALSYLFLREAAEYLHTNIPEDFKVLAMLATIADCTSMASRLNRAICVQGIDATIHVSQPGLKKLLEEQAKPHVTSHTVGWYVNPVINAAGRMNREFAALQLLTSDDWHVAVDDLEGLLALNTKRQARQKLIVDEVKEHTLFEGDNLLVVAGTWDAAGVLGVVASRLAESSNKVTLITANGYGSGRVPEGFSNEVFEAMQIPGLVASGHNKAFGVKLSKDAKFVELDTILGTMRQETPEYDLCRTDYTTEEEYEFKRDLKRMDPFGKGFELPRILDCGIVDTLNPWR